MVEITQRRPEGVTIIVGLIKPWPQGRCNKEAEGQGDDQDEYNRQRKGRNSLLVSTWRIQGMNMPICLIQFIFNLVSHKPSIYQIKNGIERSLVT